MFADMIVIVEGIVTVVEQMYDLYSWYMLLVDGGSMICNQMYLIPRAATCTLLLSTQTCVVHRFIIFPMVFFQSIV